MKPQLVTDRYINNLIRNGQNEDFVLLQISQYPNVIDSVNIGHYYMANIGLPNDMVFSTIGLGAVPLQAVRRALEKHGVTFR